MENSLQSRPLFLKLNTVTITISGLVTHYHCHESNDRCEYVAGHSQIVDNATLFGSSAATHKAKAYRNNCRDIGIRV